MNVIVFDRLSVPAWSGQEFSNVPSWPCLPLPEALRLESKGELLMSGYGSRSGQMLPRLSKAALSRFARDPDVQLNVVLVDIDYPNKEVPPDAWHLEVLKRVPASLGAPGWYRTAHGLRLVWALETPIPLIQADSALAWVHETLNAEGIPTDRPTADWTRMQRCPYVFGRNLPHCDFDAIPTLTIPALALVEATARELGSFVSCDRPDAPPKLTRSALAPIKKIDATLADNLYQGTLSAPVGERHATLLKCALTISFALKTLDPRDVYNLLHGSAVEMGKDLEELWRLCEWACAAYSSHTIEQAKLLKEAETRAGSALRCAPQDVQQRVILDSGKEFYIWDEEGQTYSKPFANQRQLLNGLKLHAPVLAGDVLWSGDSTQCIIRDYSSPLNRIVYSYNVARAHYDAHRRELTLPCVAPDPTLVPEYNPQIDAWLKELFGPHHYESGLRWLAACPRLDRPVCALYLRAAPSVGKGMLTLGIARLWSPQMEYTSYEEIVSDFRENLLRCPLIVADEKVPQGKAVNDSSIFRRIVGNGVHPINIKHQTPVTLLGFPRVLITANNEDALHIREDLDQDDLDAVRLRIGYIDREGDTAAQMLLQRLAKEAGFDSTYDFTSHWVSGGGIARHILWLQEHYVYQADHRFLVEGWDSEFTRKLATAAGTSGIVAETLVLAIRRGVYSPAVRWFDGAVYVNAPALAAEWRSIHGHDVDRAPNNGSRLKALRALSGGRKRTLRENNGSQNRYWEIPAPVLAKLAEDRNLAAFEEIILACERSKETEEKNNINVVDMRKRV